MNFQLRSICSVLPPWRTSRISRACEILFLSSYLIHDFLLAWNKTERRIVFYQLACTLCLIPLLRRKCRSRRRLACPDASALSVFPSYTKRFSTNSSADIAAIFMIQWSKRTQNKISFPTGWPVAELRYRTFCPPCEIIILL